MVKLKAVESPKAVQWAAKVCAAKERLEEAKGEHKAAWASFADDPDYHKRAFKDALKTAGMDDLLSRAEYLRKRKEYEDQLGVYDQLPLPLSDQAPAA